MISSETAAGVDVGGVDQRAAGLDEAVELGMRSGLVGLGAEGHRAEAELGNGASTAAESAIVHGLLSITAAGDWIAGRRADEDAVLMRLNRARGRQQHEGRRVGRLPSNYRVRMMPAESTIRMIAFSSSAI